MPNPSLDGIEVIGDYATPVDAEDKVQVLIDLIPDPDTINTSGAQAGGGNLDEMSPIAAAHLRVELGALQAEISSSGGPASAFGEYTADGDDASADEMEIDTGLDTSDPLTILIVDIIRGGVSVKDDAIVTDNEDGTFTITEDSEYSVTSGDVVHWAAQV